MAKSLLCAGTTWPGVFTAEDQRAWTICVHAGMWMLIAWDVLGYRVVDCEPFSWAVLIRAFVVLLRRHDVDMAGLLVEQVPYAYWMCYVPLLPRDLDYPEVLALRAPLPTLVQNNEQDSLFTMPEMERADKMMAKVFQKAGATDRYRCSSLPAPTSSTLKCKRKPSPGSTAG